jgi:hypothetical protein
MFDMVHRLESEVYCRFIKHSLFLQGIQDPLKEYYRQIKGFELILISATFGLISQNDEEEKEIFVIKNNGTLCQ